MNKQNILASLALASLVGAGGVSSGYAAPKSSGSMAGSYLSSKFAQSNGDMDDAIRRLRQVHKDSPEDTGVMIQLEGLLLLKGDVEEALNLADEIENSDAIDPLADLTITLSDLQQGDLEDAAEVLAGAGEDGTVQLWVPLVACWVDLARDKLVKPVTMAGLGIDVGRAGPLVNYHLALINDQAGFKEAAANNFKAAIDDPANPPSRIIQRLLQFYEHNKSPATLTALVQKYKKAHPTADTEPPMTAIVTPVDGVAEILYTMGGVMYGAGVVGDAAVYLQLAAYIKPEMDEAVVALADAYGELKQYNLAKTTYARITPQSHLYLKSQLSIAVIDDRNGSLPDALKQLDSVAKALPDAPDIYLTRGDLLRAHSRLEEAIAAYNEALKKQGSHNEKWVTLFARAACLDRLGKWPEAEKDLQDALVLNPNQPDVLNYLGFASLEHDGDVGEARQMIEKAVKERPGDAEIIDSMGWALYKQGEYTDAAKYLEKAIELLPGDAEVNDHLGDVYWRLGRKTEARFQWERALTFSPEAKLEEALHKKLKQGLPAATLAAGH